MLERPSDAVLDAFAAIVGPAYALRDTDAVAPYVTDPRGRFSGHTPLVLRPGSVEEVIVIPANAGIQLQIRL